MKYLKHSHRYGLSLMKNEDEFIHLWEDITTALDTISEEDIINYYNQHCANSMSISKAINNLIKERLLQRGWNKESPIFQATKYRNKRWRLDFAKDKISIEVAFNHGEAIAWNLLKPVMASELNHIEKAIQTKVGVLITATKDMKKQGAFDGACGEYEKVLRYLTPMNDILTVPMVIIGLKAPQTFRVKKHKINGKNIGVIERFTDLKL
ncbi:BglII/BstYI family type II restriction endonuclease [Senegalia massiliensis]|uniref:Restriction endonuclease n=1 Tax=Senegalia massiliensis TaxID=1720316 RepID=A0A845QTD9_9CLOT|nr:BglII/BstYI family type II restriction endonuclease [Senegalia massiliensis]NBI06097.1 hypothetical protein [Senegalia massiliensis]